MPDKVQFDRGEIDRLQKARDALLDRVTAEFSDDKSAEALAFVLARLVASGFVPGEVEQQHDTALSINQVLSRTPRYPGGWRRFPDGSQPRRPRPHARAVWTQQRRGSGLCGEEVATRRALLFDHPWRRLPRLGVDCPCCGFLAGQSAAQHSLVRLALVHERLPFVWLPVCGRLSV
jgi:hypothetical protein